MKVKDLLLEIKGLERRYPDVLEWDIALEQHPDYKACPNCNNKDDSIVFYDLGCATTFIKSHAIGCVQWYKKKILGIQIHY